MTKENNFPKVFVLIVGGVVVFLGIFFWIREENSPASNTQTDSYVLESKESTSSQEASTSVKTNVMNKAKKQYTSYPEMVIKQQKTYQAVLTTSKGVIKLNLFSKEVPKTVNNFVFLSREGFYNETKFHRIIKGFMIQGGDPEGTGRGGPGYRFEDESVTREYKRGIIAMANAGPNTNGSQFFIMHADYSLPKNYTIFGEVIEGIETIDKLAESPVKPSFSGESSTPVEDILLKSVEILED